MEKLFKSIGRKIYTFLTYITEMDEEENGLQEIVEQEKNKSTTQPKNMTKNYSSHYPLSHFSQMAECKKHHHPTD